MSAWRRRAVVVVAAAIGGSVACGSFDASPSVDPTEGGQGGDAGAEASDAGVTDAASESGYVCGDAAHTFCDDFDRPQDDAGALELSRWSGSAGTSSFSFATEGALSEPNTLRLNAPTASGMVYLEKELPIPTLRVVCTFAVRLAASALPDAPAAVVKLTLNGTNEQVAYATFVYPAGFGPYVYRLFTDGGATGDDGTREIDAGQATRLVPVRVELQLDAGVAAFNTTIAGDVWTQKAPALVGAPTNFTLQVGLVNSQFMPDAGYDIRFDDVACDVE